ncbi:AMP-dependent synthetase [Pollutimonas nitritireducens]|uniref:AMP-dependent synthetase n=1 Tax=Pollutimonas nitritireducens TaxID=2045209 RepID=A0A2N4UCA9_9BURK|nr:AMP-binding protein [Pollutimonas nitritireducens]PLC52652.1 AMP-dependent synthetase [Pollutimonas nitritireducens]
MDDIPLHEYLRLHARTTPDKTAIVWYGYEMSYAELDRLSDNCAAFLRGLGVRRGEPVALFMQNCCQYIIAHFGIQKLGAIVSPCSPLFKHHELNYQLRDLECRVIIAAENLVPIVQAARPQTRLQHVISTHYGDFLPELHAYTAPEEIKHHGGDCAEGTVNFCAVITNSPSAPIIENVSLDDIALLAYTSGTTGRPKGAMLTYRNALFKARGGAIASTLTQDDIHLAIPPLYHISGMLCGINIPIYLGGTIVLHYRFNPLSTLESIERYRPTYWKAIAPMLPAIMEDPELQDFDLSSLRKCPTTSFGIRTTPELAERWQAFTGGAQVFEAGYGLTETHTFDSVTPPDAVRWGTNGKLLPEVECKILSVEDQKALPAGEEGEIFLRSPGCFKGYWNQPEKTAETLIDGWVRTGDIGRLDIDGYLTLSGRIKELIKVSGYSVFPEDVESILMMHPGVEQVAVIGVDDAKKGQVVVAFVVPRPGSTLNADELIAWSRDNMSAYKVPKAIEFREALPMTASGKVKRNQLLLEQV